MLDFLSEGRAALNLVTSSTDLEARNFGQDTHLEHAARYERAREFVDVLRLLWDSWEDGALVFDKETGEVADPTRIHQINWRGRFFSVRGPLNLPRPPQGHPVIIQAGVSESGQAFAAKVADIVFSVQGSFESAQKFYVAAQHRIAAAGRPAGSIKIMPGLLPILGRTAEEAAARDRELQDLVPVGLAVAYLSDVVQHDLSRYPIDGPLPDLPETNGERGRLQMIMHQAQGGRGRASIRALAVQMVQNRGHWRVVGTARGGGGCDAALVRGRRLRWLQHPRPVPSKWIGGIRR